MEKNSQQNNTHSLAKIRNYSTPVYLTATILYLALSIHYFVTGLGGAMYLVVSLVPLAFIMYTLAFLVNGQMLYPKLGAKLNVLIAILYIAICVFVSLYMRIEYEALIYLRAGFFNNLDKVVAVLILALIVEYTRREHIILFYLIVFLMLYSVYGSVFPGIFGHPGVSWMRVITSSSIEIKLGLFGTYSQTGVAVIAAFFMFLGIAQGFGVQKSIVKTFVGILGKHRALIPQTAVLTSMAISTCSGSGAANVAVTGQYTIPLMKRAGFPPLYAGAVEASASLGGLLMPPVMAIAGFLMADFLGVSYFEVIARGFAPALIFYFIVVCSVYLLSARFLRGGAGDSGSALTAIIEKFSRMDIVNTSVFFIFIGVLIYLMGVLWVDASKAALIITIGMFITASVLRICLHPGTAYDKLKEWIRCVREGVVAFAEVTAPLILLLAMLGVMINMFVVSGWMPKLMSLLISVGQFHVLALIGVGFAVGVFLGLGIPPSACYLISAVVVIPPMTELGINPWIAHFFLFFIAVISEYSPPTSLVAAVASRLSGASFMATMMVTLKISIPFFFLTFAIFNWDILLLEPGAAQFSAIGALSVACLTATVAIHGKIFENTTQNLFSRLIVLLTAVFILFYPRGVVSVIALIPALFMIVFVIRRSSRL